MHEVAVLAQESSVLGGFVFGLIKLLLEMIGHFLGTGELVLKVIDSVGIGIDSVYGVAYRVIVTETSC